MSRFHDLKVLSVEPAAEDAIEITLELPAAVREEFRALPGQHVVVAARPGASELRRTYSLVNDPAEPVLRIVPRIHARGEMSQYLARAVRPGQTLSVLPPGGSFTVRNPVRGATYVAFAAGAGITPVLSLSRALLKEGARVILFYGNVRGARAMCLESLLELKDRHLADFALHCLMSQEPQEIGFYNGRLDAAHVREAAGHLFPAASVAGYFVCGPGDMIETVGATLRELGVEAARIHAEHFTLATTAHEAPAPAAAPPRAGAAAAGETEVVVNMDGRRRSFTMRPGDETVLDGAARAGIELPFSCRAGVCSTCRTKLVRGAVSMTQNYALEDWEVEQGYVLACQSHVTEGPLELDYDEK